MAKFVFTLKSLLTARKQEEERHQMRVATVERERQALEDRLRRQHLGIQDGVEEVREALVGAVAVDTLRAHAGARLAAMREADRIVRELAAIQRRLDDVRDGLVKATRDRRAIELLKEKQFEQWKRDENRREDQALDELATIRASRPDELMENS